MRQSLYLGAIVLLCVLPTGVSAGPCPDADGDGFFGAPGCGTARDCDDADPGVHPAAEDGCDGVDNDCDGEIEESCNATCSTPMTFHTAEVVQGFPVEQPKIAWNGQDYLAVWLDSRRFGLNHWEVYSRLVDRGFRALGPETRLTTGQSGDTVDWPNADPVVWGGDSFGILVRSDSTGGLELMVLDRFGVAVSRQPVAAETPVVSNLIWDGTGFAVVYSLEQQLWLARFDASGQPRGTQTQVTTEAGDYRTVVLRGSGSGYGVAHLRLGDPPSTAQVELTRIDASGVLAGSTPLSPPAASISLAMGWSGSSFLVVWRTETENYDALMDIEGSIVQDPAPHGNSAAPKELHWIGGEYVGTAAGTQNYVRRLDDTGATIGNFSLGGRYVWNGHGFGSFNSGRQVRLTECDCSLDRDGDGTTSCLECDDFNSAVFPGGPGICDGLNNDCSHPSWPGLENTEEVDDDGDNLSECDGDCDDTRALTFPGAEQVCDGRNNDCEHPTWPASAGTNEGDDDGDAYAECNGDCDDSREQTYPGAPETCDGLNNDCTDANWPIPPADEIDADGDGFIACADCDDTNSAVNSISVELCNGIDDDCNGFIDDDELGDDTDGDGEANACDNCRLAYNPAQGDLDQDGIGNSCDVCLFLFDPDQDDLDSDGDGDLCDNCPTEANVDQGDLDGDGAGDVCDNCPLLSNTGQVDADLDTFGNACDLDDGMVYLLFNSPAELEWQEETGFDAWNVYRGDLRDLILGLAYTQEPGSNSLAGRECSVSQTYSSDAFSPSQGLTAFYLINGMADGESGLGANSSGDPRPNAAPCP